MTEQNQDTDGVGTPTEEGQVLYTPSSTAIEGCQLTRYMRWLRAERSLDFEDYAALHQWSTQDLAAFWQSLVEYFEVRVHSPFHTAIGQETPRIRADAGSSP